MISGLAVSACGSSSASNPNGPSVSLNAGLSATAKADLTCNKAVLADQPITAAQLSACNKLTDPSQNTCSVGSSVYEAVLPGGSTALLRVGAKPVVYGVQDLYESEIDQLCGDPISSGLTPPKAPLTQAQVKALFPNGPSASS